MDNTVSSYSLGERVFRTAVFQTGVAHASLEKSLIRFITGCQEKTCHPNVLDPARATNGLELWKRLGAKKFTAHPEDTKAKICGVTWRAADLKDTLQTYGAKWERLEISEKDGSQRAILAILPPDDPQKYPGWVNCERDILKFGWKREVVTTTAEQHLEVFVTCNEAQELLDSDLKTKIFLHSNSASVSYIMLKKRAGFYLGMMQDICFYDPRGTWESSGIASEGGYYNDILAVYNMISVHYSPEKIWVSGACLGCSAAVFLKAKTGASFNLILENGFMDLEKDFIGNENLIVKVFAKRFWRGLFAKDISASEIETGFSIESTWQKLRSSPCEGKIVVVGVKNDQRLPLTVYKHNLQVAKRMSNVVYPMLFDSSADDRHFDRYYNYPEGRRYLIQSFKANPVEKFSFAELVIPAKRKQFPIKQAIMVGLIALCLFYVMTSKSDTDQWKNSLL